MRAIRWGSRSEEEPKSYRKGYDSKGRLSVKHSGSHATTGTLPDKKVLKRRSRVCWSRFCGVLANVYITSFGSCRNFVVEIEGIQGGGCS